MTDRGVDAPMESSDIPRQDISAPSNEFPGIVSFILIVTVKVEKLIILGVKTTYPLLKKKI